MKTMQNRRFLLVVSNIWNAMFASLTQIQYNFYKIILVSFKYKLLHWGLHYKYTWNLRLKHEMKTCAAFLTVTVQQDPPHSDTPLN